MNKLCGIQEIGRLTVEEATKERKSGHTGVYRQAKSRKWAAQITFKGKTYYLGAYDKIEDAVKARKRGEEIHGDFLDWYRSQEDAVKAKELSLHRTNSGQSGIHGQRIHPETIEERYHNLWKQSRKPK